ncbi:MAG: CotH kinase family protein [Rikenellaceae bacterium]
MLKYTISLLVLTLALTSCRNEDYIYAQNYDNDVEAYDPTQEDTDTYPDWTAETHGNDVAPDIDLLFPEQAEVLRMDLTISTTNLSTMNSNLRTIVNNNSAGSINTISETPVWVSCTVTFDDTDWYQVGVRYKGNSSLSQTYSSSNSKYSFKLDFDQFEDDYPALKNQRFHGFKQLNLNSNYNDYSFIRDKVVADLFREFNAVSAHANFCELYVNGTYYGLYTIIEEVDDSVIKTQFDDSSGNAYKPEISFSSSSYSTSGLYLKTNTFPADYSDANALYSALHSSNRTSDVDAWCEQLESVFDVDTFLKWLAINTTIQNWDSYGNMAHNYYLYNNSGKLTWIPWDHNEAMKSASGNYTTYTPSQLTSVSTSWPFIRYLIGVDKYKAIFDGYLRDFIDTVFEPTKMIATYESYYSLLYESVYNESFNKYSFLSKGSEFDSAISTLKTHVQTRYNLVDSYLE